jgi:pimeloyl-ACP methyl ester carboxylesterase
MVSPMAAMIRRPRERARRAKLLELTGVRTVRLEEFLMIGGMEQWTTIRGRDRSNPVLMLVHGGPGSPYTPFNSWLGDWEAKFTVVQWDQRGAGRTYIRAADEVTPELSLERIAADGIEVAEHVRSLLGRPIILVGSSVGSLTGAIMARRRPDLFAAYIAANVFAPTSAAESYRQTLAHARRSGDRRRVGTLESIGADPTKWRPQQTEDVSKFAIKASPGVPDMVYDLMLPALMYAPDLSMSDIRALDRGMKASLKALQPEYSHFDFDALGYDYALPYVIVQGASDLVSPTTAAADYFQRITAPDKDMIEVQGSGHLVEFANRPRFLEIARHVASAL